MPELPPQNLRAHNTSSTSVKVLWKPVPEGFVHGILLGYRVFYKERGAAKFIARVANQKSLLMELKGLRKFTFYTIKILAFTRIGDGASSAEISVQTDQDGRGTKT